jgi:hypothetical protein
MRCRRSIVHILITIVTVTVLDGGAPSPPRLHFMLYMQVQRVCPSASPTLVRPSLNLYCATSSGVIGAAIAITVSRACLLAASAVSVSLFGCLQPLPYSPHVNLKIDVL